MFIRETELVRLDDWADKMEKRVVSGEFLKDTKDRRKTSLVRENEHLSELRLEEGGDLITLVVKKKEGSGTVKAARTWESFNLTGEAVFQRHNFKSASYFSGPRQMAKGPLIAPLTVADKAIAPV